MEAVKAFNNELSSLYESKPPVSRAKMARITKSAIKAVKFYKHVVQSVEKFILKCRAEYKVPGLYVIDSIVRQSRHQFGVDKDVFAQRFTKNIITTFQNLLSCPDEERSKIVRVLHLWQKNSVFEPELIQQLLNMTEQHGISTGASAAEESPGENQNSQHSPASNDATEPPLSQMVASPMEGLKAETRPGPKVDDSSSASHPLAGVTEGSGGSVQADVLNAVVHLLQTSQQPMAQPIAQLLQQGLQQLPQSGLLLQQMLAQHPVSSAASVQSQQAPVSQQIHQMSRQSQQQQPEPAKQSESEFRSNSTTQFDRRSEENSQGSELMFNKRLLEFDYGESDEEDNRRTSHQIPLPEETRIQPLMMMDQPAFSNHQFHGGMLENAGSAPFQSAPPVPLGLQDVPMPPPLQHHQQQQEQYPNQMHSPPDDRQDYFQNKMPSWPNENNYNRSFEGGYDAQQNMWQEHEGNLRDDDAEQRNQRYNQDYTESVQSNDRNRFRDRNDRRKRSRDRSPWRRGHSRNDLPRRSRSRERRRRSRSRDRSRRSRSRSQDRSKERERRERERERRNRGLPPRLQENHLCICSTTLWIGHLSKQTKENDLKEEVLKFGEITTLNLITPRGCAYVSYSNRKDASRALERLKGAKILNNNVKVDWAKGVGIKESEFKDLWDVEQGVSYIPWNKMPENIDSLAEGGYLDEDSLPEDLRNARREQSREKEKQTVISLITPEGSAKADARNDNTNIMVENGTPALLPPPMAGMLPTGVIPPLLPPPPGFHPHVMMAPGMPPMMRLPPPPLPPQMHGMIPHAPVGGAPLPPPRLGLPINMEAVGESEKAAEPKAATSEGLPLPPPGMGFGWPANANVRHGMMRFGPPPTPFFPGAMGGRMPFPPHMPRMHDPGELEGHGVEPEKTKNEATEEQPSEVIARPVEDEMDGMSGAHEIGGPGPLPLWPPVRMGGPPGPRPDFMTMRERPPFGPRAFPGGMPPRPPGVRSGRGNEAEEEFEEIKDDNAITEVDMDIGSGDDEINIPGGPDSHGFHPNFGGPRPWMDFRGPRVPLLMRGPPHGMRMPGHPHPRLPFDDQSRSRGPRPPFRGAPPPLMMGEEHRFNGPQMGFRGRPPLPPMFHSRGPGMPPNFSRPPLLEPPFNRPPFGGHGIRPPHARGFSSATMGDGYYDMNADPVEEKEEEENPGDNWNEDVSQNVEQWPSQGVEGDMGEPGGRRPHWRGEMESEEQHDRKSWRSGDGRRDNWKRDHKRDWEGGDFRRNDRPGHWRQEDESGDGSGMEGGRRRMDEEGEPWNKRGRYVSDERTPKKSAWGEFFDSETGNVIGLEESKGTQSAAEKSEKKPRKTRWSNIEPSDVQPVVEDWSDVPDDILQESESAPVQQVEQDEGLTNEEQNTSLADAAEPTEND